MTSPVHHPVFARAFHAFISPSFEKRAGEARSELLAGLHGRVLEIGCGDGPNFNRYPETVTEVVAGEPEKYLRLHAERAAAEASGPIIVTDWVAEKLPEPDGSFDAAVAGLVLCSVSDQPPALRELRRVLKPGGELRFLEHIRDSNKSRARVQLAADRLGIWPFLGGGCHCSRDTVRAIADAGFTIEQSRSIELWPGLATPWVIGIARAPMLPP
jgi:ubiquinone/menaquinone biosynthesis C-methylase UbiE